MLLAPALGCGPRIGQDMQNRGGSSLLDRNCRQRQHPMASRTGAARLGSVGGRIYSDVAFLSFFLSFFVHSCTRGVNGEADTPDFEQVGPGTRT